VKAALIALIAIAFQFGGASAVGEEASSNRKRDDAPLLDPDTAANKALFNRIQEATFRYFWDGAEPVSGMAREGSGSAEGHGPTVVTVGGSGFGVAAVVVAVSRGWVTRRQAVSRLLTLTRFLELAHEVNDPVAHRGYHGAWSHWLSADAKSFAKTIPFGDRDDGGDIVETADMIQGLLLAQSYFDANDGNEAQLRQRIQHLWESVDWSWYASSEDGLMRWHWSPRYGYWKPADPVGKGWNEALNVYVLGASAPDPKRRITKPIYDRTWVDTSFGVDHAVRGYVLHLPPAGGGPLFFAHYSFIALDPRRMQDQYDNYWRLNVTHVLSNRDYAVYAAPPEYRYSEEVWGLTASQGPPLATEHGASYSYAAWAPPPGPDSGTIAPTAALSSFPYTPYYSMQALRWFAEKANGKLSSGPFGFYDAFNLSKGWYSNEYLAIDQGPIVCMMENYRTGLLWRLFDARADIRAGLQRLGLDSLHRPAGFYLAVPEARTGAVELMKHIETGAYQLDVNARDPGLYTLRIERADSSTAITVWNDRSMPRGPALATFDGGLSRGRYRAHLTGPSMDEVLPVVLH
jgi:hypothetical protein